MTSHFISIDRNYSVVNFQILLCQYIKFMTSHFISIDRNYSVVNFQILLCQYIAERGILYSPSHMTG